MYNLSLELNLTVISAQLAQKGRIRGRGRVSWIWTGTRRGERGEEGAEGGNIYALRVVECESSFFFFFKNDERRPRSIYSFSWLLIIMWLNAVLFVASIIPPYKSPASSFFFFYLSFLFFHLNPLPRPSRSRFRCFLPPNVAVISSCVPLAHADTRQKSQNALGITQYRPRNTLRNRSGEKNNRNPPCVLGGGEAQGRGRLVCYSFSLIDNIAEWRKL